jgi:molybdopterin-guanine dinucleotide biosynthesis protein A
MLVVRWATFGVDPARTGMTATGITKTSIEQQRSKMFPDSAGQRKFNGTIRGENRSGWVLAGGRSSRMGQDKALLELDGIPLALRAAEELCRVCGQVALVGDPGRYARLGLPVTPDSYPGQGPLAGIEAALGATASDANLVVACDMPALNPGILTELLSAEADVAIPRYPDGKLEPLCAGYSRRCHAVIREALESGVRRVTDAFRLLEARGFALSYVAVARRDPFENLNTPDELAAFRSRRRHG